VTGAAPYAAVAVVLVVLATVAIGVFGLRLVRTTGDFLVASRAVSPLWNASAISGEYLSAASFLGIAGLVLVYGPDALWYPVGFVAGYLLLLVLVAAPLRRSGAHTVPDFAEARLGSSVVRRLASLLVVVIGWLYLVPQLQGAGLTLRATTGAPAWLGPVVVAVVVAGNVALGGMRSATFVQAFQYWLKLTALAVPAVVLVLAWHAGGAPHVDSARPPVFHSATTVRLDAPVRVELTQPVPVVADGRPELLAAGPHRFAAGTTLDFPAGAAVPPLASLPASTGGQWALPLSGAGGRQHPLYTTYAVVVATLLGTMGLPHVLVRFYASPDGRAARRSALGVLGLLGVFYLLPTIFGALGRLYTPELLLTGRTDAVVLALPGHLLPGLPGLLLGALVTAGAFAAFLSTSSGLVVSVAGVLVRDVLRRPVRDLRRATVVAAAVPLLLALLGRGLPVTEVVTLAFAVAASTFCPLLVLGIWWRGLTAAGAVAGLVTGGALSGLAVGATLIGLTPSSGWAAVLLGEPAAWVVPLSTTAMVLGSLLTRSQAPSDVGRTMLTLHAPEALRTPAP
jgi:Na+(H+)/acetate symporter ActP